MGGGGAGGCLLVVIDIYWELESPSGSKNVRYIIRELEAAYR
jgi:hypothetical protein